MGRKQCFLLGIFSLLSGMALSDWNIMNLKWKLTAGLDITWKNYCEGWRMNVELNNIREFDVVPAECVDYVGKYMTSTQYKVDFLMALEESALYFCSLKLVGDGKDAWVFDVDETLLSTTPYYKKHHFGGEMLNRTSMENWMMQAKAPALEHSLSLYNKIKERGVKIFIISSRGEFLRDATTDNLIKAGYHGWTSLILRDLGDGEKSVQEYKAEQRKLLIERGYRIWGVVGDQWSSLVGLPKGRRTFKLPNCLYYDA